MSRLSWPLRWNLSRRRQRTGAIRWMPKTGLAGCRDHTAELARAIARGWKRQGGWILYIPGHPGRSRGRAGLAGSESLAVARTIGDPFDLRRSGPSRSLDTDNAMILTIGRPLEADPSRSRSDYKYRRGVRSRAWITSRLGQGRSRGVVGGLEDNRPVLRALASEGTDRPDSLCSSLNSQDNTTWPRPSIALQDLRELDPRLAMLEVTPRIDERAMSQGAWRYYRRILRSSRHAGMHGGSMASA